MVETPLPFDGPELMFGDLLPKPVIFRVFFDPFLIFLQCLLINGTFYEPAVFIRGAQVSYGTCSASFPVLVMLDLVPGLIVNGSVGVNIWPSGQV